MKYFFIAVLLCTAFFSSASYAISGEWDCREKDEWRSVILKLSDNVSISHFVFKVEEDFLSDLPTLFVEYVISNQSSKSLSIGVQFVGLDNQKMPTFGVHANPLFGVVSEQSNGVASESSFVSGNPLINTKEICVYYVGDF